MNMFCLKSKRHYSLKISKAKIVSKAVTHIDMSVWKVTLEKCTRGLTRDSVATKIISPVDVNINHGGYLDIGLALNTV
jgi:hypothetical protein